MLLLNPPLEQKLLPGRRGWEYSIIPVLLYRNIMRAATTCMETKLPTRDPAAKKRGGVTIKPRVDY